MTANLGRSFPRDHLVENGQKPPDVLEALAAAARSPMQRLRYNRNEGPVPNILDRITQNPNVLAGRATIRGLRICVAHIVNLVANGMAPAEIVADLPDLDLAKSWPSVFWTG